MAPLYLWKVKANVILIAKEVFFAGFVQSKIMCYCSSADFAHGAVNCNHCRYGRHKPWEQAPSLPHAMLDIVM